MLRDGAIIGILDGSEIQDPFVSDSPKCTRSSAIHLLFICLIVIVMPSIDRTHFSAAAQWKQSPPGPMANNKTIRSINEKYNEYCRFNYQNIALLAGEAERNGITTSQKEIDAQKAIIKKMFPGVVISEDIARNEILARKYTQTILNISLPKQDKEQAYKEILAQFSEGDGPSELEISSLIEIRAIANCQVMKKERERIATNNEKMQVKYENENTEEMWGIEDLQIRASDNTCLARIQDSCLLTVQRYNSLVKFQPFPKMFPLDSARLQAVRNILADEYILALARKNGYDKTENAADAIKGYLQWAAHDARYRNAGTPVTDEATLWGMYNQYYNVFFSPRKTPFYSLIGSSDSLYIDSIANHYYKKEQTATMDSTTGKGTFSKVLLPWSSSKGHPLPPDFLPAVASLHRGEISRPVRTPYGTFLARLDSVSVKLEVPFEEASETVVLLATKEKWSNFDSMITANAYQIYTSNKSLFSIKDTLSLVFFMYPGQQPPESTAVMQKKGVKPDNWLQNLVLEKGTKLSSTQLPPDILDSLQYQYIASNKKKRFFGPVVSRYGVWYCKVLDTRPGKGVTPYSHVKQRLRDSLVIASINPDECVTYEKPDSLLSEITLARVYAPLYLDGDEKGSGVPDERSASSSVQSKIEAIEAWVAKANISIP